MTARPIVTVPRSLMRQTAVDWDIDWREKSAGEGTDGTGQTVISAAPRWFGSVPLVLPRASALEWRALRHTARGRTGLYRLPMIDPLGYSDADIVGAGSGLPFTSGRRFDTGSGVAYRPTVEMHEAAAAGATRITVRETQAVHPLRIGMLISHDDWPVEITSRTDDTDDGVPVVTLELAPFLRAPIPAGALIELAATGIFECFDGSGNPVYDLTRVARPTMNFREYLNR